MTNQQVDNQVSSEPLQDTVDARSSIVGGTIFPNGSDWSSVKTNDARGITGLNLLTPAGTQFLPILLSVLNANILISDRSSASAEEILHLGRKS